MFRAKQLGRATAAVLIALQVSCDRGPTAPGDIEGTIEIDLSALVAGAQGGPPGASVLDSVVLRVSPSGESVREFGVDLPPGRFDAKFFVSVPRGTVRFVAEVLSDTDAVVYRGERTEDIQGDRAFTIDVLPVSAVMVVRPPFLDLGNRATRTIVIENPGVDTLRWTQGTVSPTGCDGPCIILDPPSGIVAPDGSQTVKVDQAVRSGTTYAVTIDSQVGSADVEVRGSQTPIVDATVTIVRLELIPGPGRVNPSAVAGDINVVLDVQEGDETVTAIDLLIDGAPLGCAAFNTSRAPDGEGRLSFSSASAQDIVKCFWNTDDVQGTCDGSNLTPAFANGSLELGARITLSDQTTRTATNAQRVTLINSDFIMLAPVLERPATIGTNGRAYVGGPQTKMDGSSNRVSIAACPVSYNGNTIASLGIGGYTTGTAGGPSVHVDFGSGPAVVHQLPSEPFLFTIDPALGTNGSIEDDPVLLGHNFGDSGTTFLCVGNFGTNCSGQVFDETGLNVTSQFTYGSVLGMHLDFMGPTIGSGAVIEIGGSTALANVHYSTGAFRLGGATVTDLGVGLGPGTNITFAVNDCDQAAGVDCGSPPPAGVNTRILAMATGIDDLAEDDDADNDDANGFDTYEVEVTKVADLLENNASAAQLGNISNNPTGPTGVDRTAPIPANLTPPTTPADNPFYVLNDLTIEFDAADPLLASGDPGSGVDDFGCFSGSPAPFCTSLTATDEVGNMYDVLGLSSPSTFEVDIADALGGAFCCALPDGERTVTVTVPDNARPPNDGLDDFTFIYDTTAPDIKPFTDFESDATLSGSAAIFTLAGQVVDGDGVVNSGEGSTISALSVGIFTDASSNCTSLTPLVEGSGAGEVDNQLRSIADTDGGENDFTLNSTEDWSFGSSFLVQNPGVGATAYCMVVTGSDSPLDRNGIANPNTGSNHNRFTITWQ